MNDKYILEGKKVVKCPDLMKWAASFEINNRRVAETKIPNLAILVWIGKLLKTDRFEPVRVSTVFLHLDHRDGNKGEPGKPEVFETMIFGGKFDQEQWRYSTWEEAEEGHQKAVEKVQKYFM